MINIIMLKRRLDTLEKQHGGAIPFSALSGGKRSPKKSSKKKKRSISPSRARRKVTKKTRRTKKKTKQRGKTKQKGKTKKCSCGTKKYTGKEETPRGFGKCEECVPLNVVLRGTDDNLYENRKGGWFKLT